MHSRYIYQTVILFFFLLGNCQANDSIIGKWVQPVLTKGGLGGIFIFDRDGQATLIFGGILESTYRVESNYLIEIDQRDTSKRKFEKYLMKGTGDHLTLELVDSFRLDDYSTKQLTLNRIGRSENNKPPIVGKWSADGHKKGSKILFDYTKSGKVLKCFLLEYKTGRYSLEKNTLTILLEGGKSYVREIRRQHNKLIIFKKSTKKEEIYIKFDSPD